MRGFWITTIALLAAIGAGVGIEASAGGPTATLQTAIRSMLAVRSVEISYPGEVGARSVAIYQAPDRYLSVVVDLVKLHAQTRALIVGTKEYALQTPAGSGGSGTCTPTVAAHLDLFPQYSVAAQSAFIPLLIALRATSYRQIGSTYHFSTRVNAGFEVITAGSVTLKDGAVRSATVTGSFRGHLVGIAVEYLDPNAAPAVDVAALVGTRGDCVKTR